MVPSVGPPPEQPSTAPTLPELDAPTIIASRLVDSFMSCQRADGALLLTTLRLLCTALASMPAAAAAQVWGAPRTVEALPRVVELLGEDAQPQLQLEACRMLLTYPTSNCAVPDALLVSAAAPMVRLVAAPDEDTCECALLALGKLSRGCKGVSHAAQAAGLIPLVQRLLPSAGPVELSLRLQRAVTRMIAGLAHRHRIGSPAGDLYPAPPLHTPYPLLPYLAQLIALKPLDEAVQCHALEALNDLVPDGNPARLAEMLASGAVPRVVSLLRHASSTVKRNALRIVGAVALGDAEHTQALLDAGALAPLAELLLSPTLGLCSDACWVVGNICAGTRAQAEAVLAAGLAPLLAFHATQHSSLSVARWAYYALANCAEKKDLAAALHAQLAREGLVQAACAALERQWGEEALAQVQLSALRTLGDFLVRLRAQDWGVKAAMRPFLPLRARVQRALQRAVAEAQQRGGPGVSSELREALNSFMERLFPDCTRPRVSCAPTRGLLLSGGW
jgi:hypothetical protein